MTAIALSVVLGACRYQPTPVQLQGAMGDLDALHSMHPDVLRITFVRVSGGLVQGALEPYIAPDCQCAVSTVFRGAVNDAGKRIDGEYVTQGPSGLRQVGRWNVKKTSSGMPEPR